MFLFRNAAVGNVLVLGFLSVACGKPFETVGTEQCENKNKVEKAALAFPELIWQKERVGVCWQNLNEADQMFANLVQQQVTKYWDSQIEIDFVGWERCGANDTSKDIKIKIADERSWSVVGTMASFSPTSMSLNFTFNNFAPECAKSSYNLLYCISYVAVHEFGHALGLDHEQNRPDTPEECAKAVEVEKTFYGSRAYGEWDEDSIMNYCSTADRPSCKDIAAVQDMYGPESDNTANLVIGQ